MQPNVPHTPTLPGLTFRRFRGAADYPHMVAVLAASAQADRIERSTTVEDLAARYTHLTNCDPYQDLLIADVAGEMAGYARGWWWDEPGTGRLYGTSGFLVPAWRRRGIGRALLAWLEQRLRAIAATHPADHARFFQSSVEQYEAGTAALLERAGYQPARYFFEMLRPALDDIPDWPLPDGLEVRPARPEHYRAIWVSVDESSRDEWGYTAMDEETWLKSFEHFQPELWQIAWDVQSGLVAGHVLTFIDHPQNAQFNRKRGYTEGIGVGPAWRRRGLARALIARSLRAQKAAGMTESALTPDSENLGALRLYESCGFQVVQRSTVYRKPF